MRGANTRRIRAFEHDRLPTYGIGREKDKQHWRQMIGDLLSLRIVTQSEGPFPLLELTPEAHSVLKKKWAVKVLMRRETPVEPASHPARRKPVMHCSRGCVRFRRALASRRGVPPYVIFSDRSHHEMAGTAPRTKNAFLQIHGVGETKWVLYGELFLIEIRQFLENPPEQ